MKKIKILLVSLLTVILSLFCLASCGETGKWEVTKYKVGSVYIEVDDESYIEMKSDKTIVIAIKIGSATIEKEGTWAKGEEKGTYLLTFENSTEELTIEDDVMTYGIYQLEKSK